MFVWVCFLRFQKLNLAELIWVGWQQTDYDVATWPPNVSFGKLNLLKNKYFQFSDGERNKIDCTLKGMKVKWIHINYNKSNQIDKNKTKCFSIQSLKLFLVERD